MRARSYQLLLVAVLVVNPYQTPAEGQYFAKGDEDGVMYLCQWRTAEARQQHRAPEGAERNGDCELDFSHFIRKSYVGFAEVVSCCCKRLRAFGGLCALRAGYRCVAAFPHAQRASLRS